MSRGLGPLQRAILEALPTAEVYQGVYDLPTIKSALAKQWGAWGGWNISGAFEASFSRAVRTLITRGYLQRHLIRHTWVTAVKR